MAERIVRTEIVVALAIIIVLAGSTTASAYATADSFQNPLNSYVVTGYSYGQYLWSGLYHSGEDLKAVKYERVRAIANGKVVFRKNGPNRDGCGYGQVVVIEHKLPDGSKVCSIYGHLSERYPFAAMNKIVTKGEVIGRIGNAGENGDGGAHLHFGIRKGKYQNFLEGRTSKSGLNNFHKPSDYLNLVRATGASRVYRLSNLGNKAWISSASKFNSCGFKWGDIRPVTNRELNRHGTFHPQAIYLPAGTFIKRANNPEISLIASYQERSGVKNVFRKPLGSWRAFIRHGGKSDLSNVRIVSDKEYKLYTQGRTLY